jgi:integrase
MVLKKQTFNDKEIVIFDDAVIYVRGDYWQMRMWLAKEKKYARFSLKTRSESTAIDKAKDYYHELKAQEKSGKSYFSKTTKQGVEEYLQQRLRDVEAELIVKGRFGTIKTHLEHWLNFIGRDTKLKELERTDCENYLHSRTKTKKKLNVSQTTVANEQSTINAMMAWLYKRKETYIEAFDFKPMKRIDRGDDANRRLTFTDAEIVKVTKAIEDYIAEAKKDLTHSGNLVKAIAGYYLGVSMISGLRRGEQLQLCWKDVADIERVESRGGKGFVLLKITVRAETSKVRKTRKFVVKDFGYFDGVLKLAKLRHDRNLKESELKDKISNELIFSVDGVHPITVRALGYNFDKVVEKAGIVDAEDRELVPYSFRHYFITKRVNSNLPPAAVAEMCGTSITQIERTYYHTTEDKMVSNALADYEYKNGMLVPK